VKATNQQKGKKNMKYANIKKYVGNQVKVRVGNRTLQGKLCRAHGSKKFYIVDSSLSHTGELFAASKVLFCK
jgi:hypothetical protein